MIILVQGGRSHVRCFFCGPTRTPTLIGHPQTCVYPDVCLGIAHVSGKVPLPGQGVWQIHNVSAPFALQIPWGDKGRYIVYLPDPFPCPERGTLPDTWAIPKSKEEIHPKKSTQIKSSSERVFLNNFRRVPDSRHREEGKNSHEFFEKNSRKRGVFFGISGFWVGLWASTKHTSS